MANYLFSENGTMGIAIHSTKAAKSPFFGFIVINPKPYIVMSNRLLINFASASVGAFFILL